MTNTDAPGATLNEPFWSKINWTQGISMVAMLLAYFGVDLPPETQAAVVVAIGGVTNVVTWVFRTWFTG